MFFSVMLFPVFLAISIAIEEGGPMVVPVIPFFVSLVWMLYARLFSDKYAPAPASIAAAQTSAFGPAPSRPSLPPPINVPVPGVGRQHVRTNELAQPSVTENTTRLLDND
jgi:hypothetical protein